MLVVRVPASKLSGELSCELSGDHAADVAKRKGEVKAIETVQVKRGC